MSAIKEVVFLNKLPRIVIQGSYILDLSSSNSCSNTHIAGGIYIDIRDIYRKNENAWLAKYIDWLGNINSTYSSDKWWAYTTTAKNFLSSPLGNNVFTVLAILKIIWEYKFRTLYVLGAERTQIKQIRIALRNKKNIRVFGKWSQLRLNIPAFLIVLFRIIYHSSRVLICFTFTPKKELETNYNYLVFSYLDTRSIPENDLFFGKLYSYLIEKTPANRILYTGFVQTEYRKTLPIFNKKKGTQYYPIYYELRLQDVSWAALYTLAAYYKRQYVEVTDKLLYDCDFLFLLKEALRNDVVKGAYIHNLFVYRAARRLAQHIKVDVLFYPYENKSLEKLLLLAVREQSLKCRIIGYQHTSVTPRHSTLMFSKREAANTPLPDKIITLGNITRNYLEKMGNYPAGIFDTGCALRQVWRDPFPYQAINDRKIRILLALSSSRDELIQSVEYFRRLMGLVSGIKIGIRTHPEFPLKVLPSDLLRWVGEHASDFSGTDLYDNICWSDVTAYVSSTVALESLMLGKPVINFRNRDVVTPDPILGNVAFCWKVCDIDEFAEVLQELRAISENRYRELRREGVAYVKNYIQPITDTCVKIFTQPSQYCHSIKS